MEKVDTKIGNVHREPKKIIFFGLFGQQNIGNDCSLQAIMFHAKRYLPDAEVRCVCTGPDEIAARYNIHAFPMETMHGNSRFSRAKSPLLLPIKLFAWAAREIHHAMGAYKTFKGSHAFIVPGTGLLVDHTTGFRGYPYLLFKWSIIARFCRCKLLVVSVGAGPILHPLSRLFIRYALSLADYRSFRDAYSRDYLERIGFRRRRDPVYPDLAFSLAGDGMPDAGQGGHARRVVGVGVVDYSGHSGDSRTGGEAGYREYVGKTARFVSRLLAQNYTVRVLLGDVRYDSRVIRDLFETVEKPVGVDEAGHLLCDRIESVEQLLAQLAETDIVISPRFHNLILAMMLGKPVIALSHDPKFDSLMDGMGLGEYCVRIDSLDVAGLVELFHRVERHANRLGPHNLSRAMMYRERLDEQYDAIFDGIKFEG